MNNLFRSIFRSIFNNNNDDDDDEIITPPPNRSSRQSFDDDEMERAIEESKREFEERKNAEKREKNMKEMEKIEALQFEEIKSVVSDYEQLSKILKKLPGVNPDDRIFNEFYRNDSYC